MLSSVRFALPGDSREAEKALVILFFDSEEDYQRGDEVLSAMPADDTPGQRTGVASYGVAIRMSVDG